MQRRGDNSGNPPDRGSERRANGSGRSLQSSREISATSAYKQQLQEVRNEIQDKLLRGEPLSKSEGLLLVSEMARLASQHSFGGSDSMGRSQGNTTEFNSETEGYNSSRGYGNSSRDLEDTTFGSGFHGGLWDGGEFPPAHYGEVTRGRGDVQDLTYNSLAHMEFDSRSEYDSYSGVQGGAGYDTSIRYSRESHDNLGYGEPFSAAHPDGVTRGRGDVQSTTYNDSAGMGYNGRREDDSGISLFQDSTGYNASEGYRDNIKAPGCIVYSRSDIGDSELPPTTYSGELRGGVLGTTSDGSATMRYSGRRGGDSDINWALTRLVETTHNHDIPGPTTEIDIQAAIHNKKGTEQSSDYDRRIQALEQERKKYGIKDRKSLERGRRGGQTEIAIDGKQGSRDSRLDNHTGGGQNRRSSRDTGRSIRSRTDARRLTSNRIKEQYAQDMNQSEDPQIKRKKYLRTTMKSVLIHAACWTVGAGFTGPVSMGYSLYRIGKHHYKTYEHNKKISKLERRS